MKTENRSETGATILAAAEVVDVSLVTARLNAFASAHRAFNDAQRAVETAEVQLRAGQSLVAQRDAEQDEAVEELARALVVGGQPRSNPFAAFGGAAPSAVKLMPVGDEAKAIHKLAAAVQADQTLGKPAHRTAKLADEAAQIVETELATVDKLQAGLRAARDARATAGTNWDTALQALKRGTRAAADDGAPGLYKALFGHTRSKKKAPAPAPAPQPNPATPVAGMHSR